MGIPDDESDDAQRGGNDEGDGKDDMCGIWPENDGAWRAFLAVRRFWRIGPLGGALHLDRPNVESELRMRKIRIDIALLDDLAAIEDGVLRVWQARQSGDGGAR